MNDLIETKTGTATAAIIGLNAALAIGPLTWPADEPAYFTNQSNPSFSFFERTLTFSKPDNTQKFAKDVATVFASLAEGQEPLGADFEAVWDANLVELYET